MLKLFVLIFRVAVLFILIIPVFGGLSLAALIYWDFEFLVLMKKSLDRLLKHPEI